MQTLGKLSRFLAPAYALLLLSAFQPTAFAGLTGKPGDSRLDATLQSALATAPTARQYLSSDCAKLLDLGDLTVKSDGTTVLERRITYKLFAKRGYPLAEVGIPFNASYQSVQILSARTIKGDGKVTDVRRSDIHTLAPFENIPLYSDVRLIRFSMPAVEDNCIIDYAYRVTTRPLLMPGHFWLDWEVSGFSPSLQGTFPVELSRLTVQTPSRMPIKYKTFNDDALQPAIVTSPDGKTTSYIWERKNVEPIKPEPFMPNLHDIMVRISISSIDSWDQLSQWINGLFATQSHASSAIRTTVASLLTGKMTEEEKAVAIYDWVATHVRYVGVQLGLSAYKPHTAAEIFDKRYGDCKDKTTLLIAMLEVAGLKAYPALAAIGDPDPSMQMPTPGVFNHCITLAQIGGREIWLDPTSGEIPFGDMPGLLRGTEALVIRNGGGQFQTIPAYLPTENGCHQALEIALAPDGNAEIKVAWTKRGDEGLGMRADLRSLPAGQYKELFQSVAKVQIWPDAELIDFTEPGDQDKRGDILLKMRLKVSGYASVIESPPAASQLLIPIGRHQFSKDPFEAEARTYPMVFRGEGLHQVEATITLPEGYVLDQVPADVTATLPVAEFRRTVVKSGDGKRVTVTYTMLSKAGMIPASDYAKVRAFFGTVSKG